MCEKVLYGRPCIWPESITKAISNHVVINRENSIYKISVLNTIKNKTNVGGGLLWAITALTIQVFCIH